jgi:hypothetical protein
VAITFKPGHGKPKYRFWLLAGFTLLWIIGLQGIAAAVDDFQPRNGVVVDTRPPQDGITIFVREGPPEVSGLDYELAQPICSVNDGTQFVAQERRSLINGELWYRVTINEFMPPSAPCPPPPFSGWIIGQFANGDIVVELAPVAPASDSANTPTPDPIPTPTPDPTPSPTATPTATPTPTPDPTPDPTLDPNPTPDPTPSPGSTPTTPPLPSPTELSDTEEQNRLGSDWGRLNLLGQYWVLSIGAIFGFVVVSLERADNNPNFDIISPNDETLGERLRKIKKIYWLRLGIAVFIVNFIRFSVFDVLAGIESNEVSRALFDFMTQGFTGSFVGGFVLAVLLLKFVSFTEE